jgi:AP-3 complex subunit sigma
LKLEQKFLGFSDGLLLKRKIHCVVELLPATHRRSSAASVTTCHDQGDLHHQQPWQSTPGAILQQSGFCASTADHPRKREIFVQVSRRSDKVCNFIGTRGIKIWPDCQLIYRHYATLYFIFVADKSESELGILDLIQVFVEALDREFHNVCELDLIFNAGMVHKVLDEIVLGGMVLETDIRTIVDSVMKYKRAEQKSENETATKLNDPRMKR